MLINHSTAPKACQDKFRGKRGRLEAVRELDYPPKKQAAFCSQNTAEVLQYGTESYPRPNEACRLGTGHPFSSLIVVPTGHERLHSSTASEHRIAGSSPVCWTNRTGWPPSDTWSATPSCSSMKAGVKWGDEPHAFMGLSPFPFRAPFPSKQPVTARD